MSPIEGVSDIYRIPLLGKIRLGVKVEKPGKRPFPKALDYFNCPPEVQKVFGEKPKALQIMFPNEDPEQFAQQWLRAYSITQGLVCIGDGRTSRRKVDLATGAMASRETKRWEWKEGLGCDPDKCPEYQAKRCRRVMNLQVLLPDVPGLGVWQIDTSSFYSILNINSQFALIKSVYGTIGMVPVILSLEPKQVKSPKDQKLKTVRVLCIRSGDTLVEALRNAMLHPLERLTGEKVLALPPG
ncbi:hypothetical protein LCGC14_2456240, partial [marine sediment metagenome]